MQLSTEPPSSEGAMDAPKALQSVMINSKDYYGRNCNPHFWFRRGYLWKCEHVRMDFFRCSTGRTTSSEGGVVFPHRARYQRRRGMAVHRGADHVELPRLARPKGCFNTSAEWS